MGKKRLSSGYTSKGEVGSPMKTRLRHGDEGYASNKMQNQLRAFLKGKRVMVTIANPNKSETNKPYIKVPANEVWRTSKR
jgi:hypothetical protein|tara:strand:+ start:449 stop:688 length:240 start_codon:yes stop_codon:yes gene_type:complete